MASLSFQILASGSKGNATLVWTDNTCVIVDVGLSLKTLSERLKNSPISIEDIEAIVVSHEHNDHVRGIGVLSRRYNVPVYFSEGTALNLPAFVGDLHEKRIFFRNRGFAIGDINFLPFSTAHDAEDPVGFVIETNGIKMAFCTDLGTVTGLVRECLKGCNALVVEANHELELLMSGPYPWHLKQRIKSRLGHLSNDDCISLCREVLHDDLQIITFAHLSEVNNSPEVLKKKIKGLLTEPTKAGVELFIASQYEPGKVIKL